MKKIFQLFFCNKFLIAQSLKNSVIFCRKETHKFLIKLLNFSICWVINKLSIVTATWHTFISQFYQQTDRIVMGGPASSSIAKTYMQIHEQTATSMALYPPKVWDRFDGVYSTFKRTHFKNILHHINNLH